MRVPASSSFTVRHTPLTETLSPTRVPSRTRRAETLRRDISPALASSLETRPTSSTSPVNTVLLTDLLTDLLTARVQRHGEVLADRLDARDREPQGLGHLRHAQGSDHGYAFGADELGRVEHGELVREAGIHEPGCGLPTPLDEHTPHR